MTNEEKLKILEGASDRAFKLLSELEAGDEKMLLSLQAIDQLRYMIFSLTEAAPGIPVSAIPDCTETGVDEAPDPEPDPEPSRFTKEEVRAALNVARKEKGVKIPELLAKFNVTTFTDLPESKYEAIMTELGVA